ncbi:LIM-domain binding protein-domain-containing protein [Mycena pura]|uniref:LIM-domain binding protein-domain-containing protein n=1 Tax=Mycena pura TaxID=153505 RepID=A0AAD7E554_9AGAR|nr:LIM-domain binding protein-domain-containing protein [Mycena pura]
MSASGSYLHTDPPEFPNSDLGSFMNPMLRQAAPASMIGLNNPAFMQPQPAGPPHHMGMSANPSGPNPPMNMLQGGPDMRFPPGHGGMVQRTMGMRPAPRPPMNGMGGMPMGALSHNPQMHGGMGFPPNMMPVPGGIGGVRRVASNPNINPGGIAGLNGQAQAMMQMQQMHQQQIQHQQRLRQNDMAMMNRQQPGNPPSRPVPSNPLMGSLPQPASLNQPPSGGMPHNNFQNPIVPPQQSVSPRARTPVMGMSPGPSQPSLNRQHMPSSGDMFVDFPQNQYPPRNMVGTGQFAFNGSSTPPLNMSDHFPPTAGTPGRTSGFPPTPAQQLSMQQQQQQQQQQHGATSEGYPFMAPRPQSQHNNQHPGMQQQHSPPQQPPPHHSPHHSESMIIHPPRPQSQPQHQPPPGRPLSGAGPSHTPRPAQQPGIPNPTAILPPGRLPPQHQHPPHPNLRPQSSGSTSHQQPIAPRPPPPATQPTAGSDGTLMSASASPPDANAVLANPIPRPPAGTADLQTFAVGYGQGLIRLMQFSGLLGLDTQQAQMQKTRLSFWTNLIQEYFTPKAIMKLTLWRDSMKNEAKPFEIGVPILPRFFLVTTQSGVKSMSLTLDGGRERLYQPGHAIVECVTAVWTCRYNNGHVVTLRGPLTVHLVICSPAPNAAATAQTANAPPYVLKFDDFEFAAHSHEKYIALESIAGTRRTEEPPAAPMNGLADDEKKWDEPRLLLETASIPGEPVNAFGIPQATMRCLELAESVGQMADLISYAKDNNMGPLLALKSFSDKLREEYPQPAMMNGVPPNSFFQGSSSLPASQGTLYSSAPPSVTHPASSQQTSSNVSSPQNAPSSAANSPQKQHKTIPTKGSVASASTPTASTSGNTPALQPATLKRKGDPQPAPTEPPAKRSARRRRTTGGGG